MINIITLERLLLSNECTTRVNLQLNFSVFLSIYQKSVYDMICSKDDEVVCHFILNDLGKTHVNSSIV